MDDTFEVADDEAGKNPADLRVLVVEYFFDVYLEWGLGVLHFGANGNAILRLGWGRE
jgi:hypothetical protein